VQDSTNPPHGRGHSHQLDADPASSSFPAVKTSGSTAGSSRPPDPGERAAAARALEAIAEALDSQATTPATAWQVCGHVQALCERVALDLRRGYRAGDMDSAVGEFDRRIADLDQPPDTA
jgi:hypothetical protein